MRVRIGTGLEQRAGLFGSGLLDREHERRDASQVGGVGIGALREQELYFVSGRIQRGLHQQREAVFIARAGQLWVGLHGAAHGGEIPVANIGEQRNRARVGLPIVPGRRLDGPLGALIEPILDDADLLRRERAGGRHLRLVDAGDAAVDQAAVRASRHDGHLAAARDESGFALVEAEGRHLLGGAVTGPTIFAKDGFDVAIEIDGGAAQGRVDGREEGDHDQETPHNAR